jgi:hypothetical protein
MPETLPLFPLHTVLFPGATLGLRVFETRYLDLVRDCARNGRGFGICLILEGGAVGAPAAPAAIGTEAVIEDFGTGDDGLLTITVRGARRFHASRLRVRDNGLQVAEVEWLGDAAGEPVRPEHAVLVTLLRYALAGAAEQPDAACFDDAGWVGWRLAGLLPIRPTQRQALLQIDDPHERLQRLLSLIG